MSTVRSRKQSFYSQFDPDISAKLNEFSHYITTLDYDYLLFMSRKFCCLYDLLQGAGATPVQKPIISEKVLDLDTGALQGKRVGIIDDIVICGSTMWKTRDRLLQTASARAVHTAAFAVNHDWWVRELEVPDYFAIELSDDRAMTFCTATVNAFAIAPRPYAVDFPYFPGVELKSSHWQRVVASSEWKPFDISSTHQQELGVGSLTFFPSTLIHEKLKRTFSESVHGLFDIIKIRAYTKRTEWGLQVSLLPIVTFKPLECDSVDKLFGNHMRVLKAEIGRDVVTDQFVESFRTPSSKLRWLQYSAASVLAGIFEETIRANQERPGRLRPRDYDIGLLFGPWNTETVRAIAEFYVANPETPYSRETALAPKSLELEQTELVALTTPSKIKGGCASGSTTGGVQRPRNIIADFNGIFIALFNKRELSAREALLQAAREGRWESISSLDRLETGITWMGILEYLRLTYCYELSREVRNTLSLVLDSAIDKGIAVPIVRTNALSGLIYRAYRHGEDVLFADEEVELSGAAIEAAQIALGDSALPKLFLEKILVLLIRIGAAKRFLQVQYGPTGQEGVAKIGFYLHGAIAKYYSGPQKYADSDLWLTDYLLEKGVIQEATGGYRFGVHVPSAQVSSVAKYEATKYGTIMGMLWKGVSAPEGGTKRIDDEDITMLATCWRLRDVAAALNVLLHLAKKDLLPGIARYCSDAIAGVGRKPMNAYTALMHNRGNTALHSLHMKYLGWREGKAERAKEKAAELLRALGQPTAVLDWDSYWASQQIVRRGDEEAIFGELVGRMGMLGHRALLYVQMFEVCLALENARATGIDHMAEDGIVRSSQSKIADYMKRARTQPFWADDDLALYDRLVEHDRDAYRSIDLNKLATIVASRLESISYEISKLLPRVDMELLLFEERADSVSYKHAIYYDIIDSTATKRLRGGKEIAQYRKRILETKKAINAFVREMERDALKDKEQIHCWNGDAFSDNDGKYVFFTGEREGFSIRRVSEFVDRLFSLMTRDIHCRCLILPCDAFHSPVFRIGDRPEVEARQFMEHLSRATKKLSGLEKRYSKDQNVLMVMGSLLVDEIEKRNPKLPKCVWKGTVKTEIEGFSANSEAILIVFP